MLDGFSVEVEVLRRSVLKPFLFAIVMDVVCEEIKVSLLLEISCI